MNPVLTVEASEYLVACHLEKLRGPARGKLDIWIPSKDNGVDLLVTHGKEKRGSCAIQVKGSRDYLLTDEKDLPGTVRACGWWNLPAAKLKQSKADYWVFVLLSLPVLKNESFGKNFVIIKPGDILGKLMATHGKRDVYQVYLWITHDNRCIETRGLGKREKIELVNFPSKTPKARDYSQFLENWQPITGVKADKKSPA
jgi:hypothetical protein